MQPDEAALYERYYEHLYAVAYKYVQHRDDAADLVHDAFVRFLDARQRGLYREQGQVEAYLTTLLRRLVLDKVRRKGHRAEVPTGLGQGADPLALIAARRPADGGDPEAAALLDERRRTVRRLISALPDKEAATMVLSGAEVGYDEAAAVLNWTPMAVKSRLWRARAMAEVLIYTDPRFAAVRPARRKRRRLHPSCLPLEYQNRTDAD